MRYFVGALLWFSVLPACTHVPYLAARAVPSPASASEQVEYAQGFFDGVAGVQLFQQSWRPRGSQPRSVVVIVHGLKDHGSRYAAWAARLVADGHAVYALDHRGHGRSAGVRAFVSPFDDYLRDLDTYLAWVRAREPGRPMFLYGHSMGGAISVLYALGHPEALAGLMLSGAALKVDAGPLIIKITRSLSRSSPTAVVLKLNLSKFSHDSAAVRDNQVDPYVYQPGVPARTAAELIGAIEQIRTRMSELRLPMLVMHGGADTITPPEGSRELVARAASADKTLKIFGGFYHDLLHEVGREQVVTEALAWLSARARTE